MSTGRYSTSILSTTYSAKESEGVTAGETAFKRSVDRGTDSITQSLTSSVNRLRPHSRPETAPPRDGNADHSGSNNEKIAGLFVHLFRHSADPRQRMPNDNTGALLCRVIRLLRLAGIADGQVIGYASLVAGHTVIDRHRCSGGAVPGKLACARQAPGPQFTLQRRRLQNTGHFGGELTAVIRIDQ